MIHRLLSDIIRNASRSILLLGPRQCGKTTLLEALGPDLVINLAHEPTFLAVSSNSRELEERIQEARPRTILIDEVQRLPSILNTVQYLIDQSKKRSPLLFYLSGSSARKLKRGHANLLPGRVLTYHLGTIVSSELDYGMDSHWALSYGTLPEIVELSKTKNRALCEQLLRSYSSSYLREEIMAEALSRNIEGFSRFLMISATYSGKILDLNKLSREAMIPRVSAGRYFEVLEDTLIAKRCYPFRSRFFKKTVKHPKFFFFDIGVLNGLLKNFMPSKDRIGYLFEHLIYNQLEFSANALNKDIDIKYFRTHDGAEVDFIVTFEGHLYFIELKASQNVNASDCRSIQMLMSCHKSKSTTGFLFHLGSTTKKMGDVISVNWQEGFKIMGL